MVEGSVISRATRSSERLHGYDEYRDAVERIATSVAEITRRAGRFGVRVEVDSISQRPVRTCHTVRIRNGMAVREVILSREEFFDEFGLFRRSAVPRLEEALRTLGSQ